MLGLRNRSKKYLYLIYGFGETGKACFNYLKKKNKVLIFDDNQKKIPKKFNIFKFNILKNNIKKEIDFVIISPGINAKKCELKKFLKLNKQKIITDLDIFYLENIHNTKITITGTNGKSTTAKLLYEVLKNQNKDVRLVGNIGKPVLLEKNINKNTIFVIEASSYQIEYSRYFKTDHAMILNISPDHLERHQNIYNYVNAKFKLILRQDSKGYAYVNKKNKYLRNKIQSSNVKSKLINLNLYNLKILEKKITNPYLKNVNNLSNLSFVIMFGKKNKLNKKKIIQTANSFRGLKYRQEIVFQNKHLTIINDSKSTSFSSSFNLLKSYRNIYWLVGGIPKKGDKFILQKKYLKNINAYIYGLKNIFFKKQFKNKIKFQTFFNLQKALYKILKDIKNNNIDNPTILFSPSAASFDMFKNFEERGKYFNNLIKSKNFIKNINAR